MVGRTLARLRRLSAERNMKGKYDDEASVADFDFIPERF
jgi:hypothetical protein